MSRIIHITRLFFAIGLVAVCVRAPADEPAQEVRVQRVRLEDLKGGVLAAKGALESSANVELACKVRKGTTVKWVAENGCRVNPGELLMVLDDSRLKDEQYAQEVVVAQRWSDILDAESNVRIAEITVAQRETDLVNADIALDRFFGTALEPKRIPAAAVAGIPASLTENGSFREQLDDCDGMIKNAKSYVSKNMAQLLQSGAEADRQRLEASIELLRSMRAKRELLIKLGRQMQADDLRRKRENAVRALEHASLMMSINKAQAEIAKIIQHKERDKLDDIATQRRSCRIEAPSNISPGSILLYQDPGLQAGDEVKEGQVLLRIPDSRRMQVSLKIHEELVPRLRPEKRAPTRIVELVQSATMLNLDPISRAFSTRPAMTGIFEASRARDEKTGAMIQMRDLQYRTTEPGQAANVQVDSLPKNRYRGRLKSIAPIPSQADEQKYHVKLHPAVVSIDDEVGPDGKLSHIRGDSLKLGQTAVVLLDMTPSERVVAVPLSAVFGESKRDPRQAVFVKTTTGYERRTVMLGARTGKLVEVLEGLEEGEEIVVNADAVLGYSADGKNERKK